MRPRFLAFELVDNAFRDAFIVLVESAGARLGARPHIAPALSALGDGASFAQQS